jgi:hypothetical protein
MRGWWARTARVAARSLLKPNVFTLVPSRGLASRGSKPSHIALRGVFENLIFRATDDSDVPYTILNLRVRGEHDLTVVTGRFPVLSPGVELDLRGSFVRNAKHGLQFQAMSLSLAGLGSGAREDVEFDPDALEKVLVSSIKGVGVSMAKIIVAEFGQETEAVFDSDPQRLLKIKGVSKKKLFVMLESWKKISMAGNVSELVFLASIGLGPKLQKRIMEDFKDRLDYSTGGVERAIRANPYELCEFRGISFMSADGVAAKLGFSVTSDERYKAAITHALKECEGAGDTFVFLPGASAAPRRIFNFSRPGRVSSPHVAGADSDIFSKVSMLLNTPYFTVPELLRVAWIMQDEKRVVLR